MSISIRNERITKEVNLSGAGLELGPLNTPVVSKEEGEVYYLDHLSREELQQKYKKEAIDTESILPVDYVLKGTLAETVGKKRFDYVIASHVIEHIPDTVTWLQEIHDILEPGGVLSLAIPDKRFTFDLKRRVSISSDVIGAYLDRLKKPTSVMMYDYAIHYIDGVDTVAAWEDGEYHMDSSLRHRWNHEAAMNMCKQNMKSNEYVDGHFYVYTPASFAEILRELTRSNLLDFEVISFLETQRNELEFYVSLRKQLKGSSVKSRLQKIPLIMSEYDTYKKSLNDLIENGQMLRNEINALQNSTSWVITSPLRKVRKTITKKPTNPL